MICCIIKTIFQLDELFEHRHSHLVLYSDPIKIIEQTQDEYCVYLYNIMAYDPKFGQIYGYYTSQSIIFVIMVATL